jgi:hypothetical protein
VNAPGDASLNAADRLVIIDLFGAYAQDHDAGKPGEFLSVFTDTVELAYAQAAEAHEAAHPVWARRAPRIVSSSSDIGVLQASRGDGGP